MTKGVLLRGLSALVVTWGAVFAVSSWSASRKASPEKIVEVIETAEFADWSKRDPAEMPEEERAKRRGRLEEVGGILSRLDLRERKQLSGEGELTELFFRLSGEEKIYLIDLLFSENSERLMDVLDQLDREERQKMVERSIQEMTSGEGKEALARLMEEDPEMMNLVIKRGFKAYFMNASVDTKMSLLPFMDSIGEIVQGFAKPKVGGL